jgi:hypothetical protein
MFRRSSRCRASLALLGALLFAQAALALAACDWLRAAPAAALLSKASEPTCHDEPARNANLCLAHCLSFDQSSDRPQPQVVAMSAVPALVVAMPGVQALRVVDRRYRRALPAAPPPRILFQSFLI